MSLCPHRRTGRGGGSCPHFFSFVTCSMHKNAHQNAGNGIKETLFFKMFMGNMPPDPLEALTPTAQVGQICVPPPPQKFPSLYAYDCVKQLCHCEPIVIQLLTLSYTLPPYTNDSMCQISFCFCCSDAFHITAVLLNSS